MNGRERAIKRTERGDLVLDFGDGSGFVYLARNPEKSLFSGAKPKRRTVDES
jgi:hypothetical protein